MTLPDTGPATLELVRSQLSIPEGDTSDDARLTQVVDAVNAVVRVLPVVADNADTITTWPANVWLGATLLAARVGKRILNPGGVEAVTNSTVLYTMRDDPEVAMLLKLGDYAPPAVG